MTTLAVAKAVAVAILLIAEFALIIMLFQSPSLAMVILGAILVLGIAGIRLADALMEKQPSSVDPPGAG